MGLQAARRRYERSPNGQPKPATFGPWHLRDQDSGFTLCGQGMRGDRQGGVAFDVRTPDTLPAEPLCQRCWDRHSGRTVELQKARVRTMKTHTDPEDPSA